MAIQSPRCVVQVRPHRRKGHSKSMIVTGEDVDKLFRRIELLIEELQKGDSRITMKALDKPQ